MLLTYTQLSFSAWWLTRNLCSLLNCSSFSLVFFSSISISPIDHFHLFTPYRWNDRYLYSFSMGFVINCARCKTISALCSFFCGLQKISTGNEYAKLEQYDQLKMITHNNNSFALKGIWFFFLGELVYLHHSTVNRNNDLAEICQDSKFWTISTGIHETIDSIDLRSTFFSVRFLYIINFCTFYERKSRICAIENMLVQNKLQPHQSLSILLMPHLCSYFTFRFTLNVNFILGSFFS